MGLLFNIQPFSIHDGPGVRTSVFLKGCALACKWCHNPESQSFQPELLFHPNRCSGCGACAQACPAAHTGKAARHTQSCSLCGRCAQECYSGALEMCGYSISPRDLSEKLLKDLPILKSSGGGITFTGGEPLLQADFVAETAEILRAYQVHLALETCLFAPKESIEKVFPRMNLVFADVKCFSDSLHIRGTGQSALPIRENLHLALSLGIPMILRTPVIPGFNDDPDELARVADYEASLGVSRAELMTFHNACAGKYAALGRPFPYASAVPPTRERMEAFAEIFRSRGIGIEIH